MGEKEEEEEDQSMMNSLPPTSFGATAFNHVKTGGLKNGPSNSLIFFGSMFI